MRRPTPHAVAGSTLLSLLIAAAAPACADETDAAAPTEVVSSAAVPDATSHESLAPASSRHAKAWSTSTEIDGNSYRMSLSRGKLDMGVGFDTPVHPTQATSTTPRSTDPARPIVPSVPSLSVGLRSETAGAPASSLIARASDAGTAPASTRRVGLEWKPVQSRLFVRGGLGLRLSGDDQVTMKLRSGRIGLYMKSTF